MDMMNWQSFLILDFEIGQHFLIEDKETGQCFPVMYLDQGNITKLSWLRSPISKTVSEDISGCNQLD